MTFFPRCGTNQKTKPSHTPNHSPNPATGNDADETPEFSLQVWHHWIFFWRLNLSGGERVPIFFGGILSHTRAKVCLGMGTAVTTLSHIRTSPPSPCHSVLFHSDWLLLQLFAVLLAPLRPHLLQSGDVVRSQTLPPAISRKPWTEATI